MLAYHSNTKLKTQTVTAMKADIKAERLVGGHYWNGKNGCFVGCVIRGDEHSKFEDILGIPQTLARLGDGIFEGLSEPKLRQKFVIDFLSAIPIGADLSIVFYKFIYWLLVDKKDGILQYAKIHRTKNLILKVADLYKKYIDKELSLKQFGKAIAVIYGDAAYAAAVSFTYHNAAAHPDYADYTIAACAAAAAHTDYAAAAAYAADVTNACKQSRIRQADKLIKLMKDA